MKTQGEKMSDSNDFQCLIPDCKGMINMSNPILVKDGFGGFLVVFACDKCGRLHSHEPIALVANKNQPEKGVYFKDKKMVLLPEKRKTP